MNVENSNPGFGWFAKILGLLAFCCWIPLAAQAVEQSNSSAENNAGKSVPTGVAVTNATGQTPQPTLASGSLTGSNGLAAHAASATNSSSASTMDTLDDRHKLNIGDRLSFRIVEDEDDPKQIVVTDSGDLELPYLGRYPAVGKTCKQLAWKLKAELEKDYYYHATVIVAVNEWAKAEGKIYIVGPVRSPGPQEIPSDEVLTVSKAILRAGGFGDYADRSKVEVRRKSTTPGGKDQVFKVDVAQILDKGKSAADLPLEADDLIFVPERLIRL